jgi:hypothetical protein
MRLAMGIALGSALVAQMRFRDPIVTHAGVDESKKRIDDSRITLITLGLIGTFLFGGEGRGGRGQGCPTMASMADRKDAAEAGLQEDCCDIASAPRPPPLQR